ncbi:BUD32 protein kinase [Coccidioides immitis RS]|uniref:EKC/KEOPS complex subunit BUD32 n=2 Tax=Coccidioides immitis TaxID=5501 RepID=BUD32_COCIM|nr:BUD32 protein kinase [Coccidioides immitis RS]Q1EBD3.1 RecName: Full=EKC/KEOPS complex subunit BUD32; AltName: Full=Atypical serine/threonine protein kinase BUD32 [Coccidioides immitis RS]EAS34776.3 BUD32 protein kinase [Coccidioides immitis RS]KMO99952.1 serine/threonine-protein kinase bud32 [Coccidioides immitis RMSCC 2394]TPX26886.1 serine/threonine-protein kinase bud32 [Coccidioides immitis]
MTEEFTPPPLPPPFTSNKTPPVLLAQGAEARLYKTDFLNPSFPAALKFRPSKPYRHPILDRRLTRQRVLQEARCLVKLLKEGIPVPGVLSVDWNTGQGEDETGNGGAWLLMEWIEGPAVRQVVNHWEKWMKHCESATKGNNSGMNENFERSAEEDIRSLLRRIGRVIGALHKAGVIHGDLTTSNLILRGQSNENTTNIDPHSTTLKPNLEGEIVLIDFGLASQSVQDEDRAVDLYVLERAFGSSHPRTEIFFDEVLKAYRESFKGASSVLETLKKVRMRGRKRSMVG